MKLSIYPAVSEMQIANRRAKHFGDILKLLHCMSLLGKALCCGITQLSGA